MNLAKLLQEKNLIEARLGKLIYGSIEVRDGNNKRFLYVHFRENGRLRSRYVGEYSTDLYNVVLENNNAARAYKKRLREINKELSNANYVEGTIDAEVALNADLARRNLVDSVYKQAMLEGVATTYSDTETLVNGGVVHDMTADDVLKIINLKHAWEFILSKGAIEYPSDFAVVSEINAIVQEGLSYDAGNLRSVPVAIGGTKYVPPHPFESQVKEDIRNIIDADEPALDRAINILLYVKKKQLFLDGNKRTAVIFANHVLIKNAAGLIVIPAELVKEYKKVLIAYYEDEDKKSEIIKFLKEKCHRRLK